MHYAQRSLLLLATTTRRSTRQWWGSRSGATREWASGCSHSPRTQLRTKLTAAAMREPISVPVLARINILAGLPEPPRDPASPETELAALQRAALSALYASELGRARGDRDAGEAWLRTADACADATLPWEEAYACLRAAEALLLRGRGGGAGAATAIRRGLRLAAELEAQPLSSRLDELATMAHIRLDDVEAARGDVAYPGLEGLTEREREILGYVVAGRTYAEIAAELTISEKTVSSHISSLLRKTGATNRIHLSQIASETLRR